MIVHFGSTVGGTDSNGSDLDLAFLPEGEMDETAVTAEVVRLTHWNDVDVVNLAHADPLTAMEIVRHGAVLFSKDGTDFPEFCSMTFRRYVDTEKLRRAQRRALDLFEGRHEPG